MTTYFVKYYARIFQAVWQHLELLFFTLAVGILISLVLSFFIYRYKILTAPLMVVLEILYTIPSLAFFALLIPFSGIGMKTAIIVLTSYSLFFLVRNFLEGLNGIDPQIVEAAQAIGYSPKDLFMKIQLPLSMPAIIAGIRLAAVSTIGIGCIAYAIGAGGIGSILFEGMRQMSYVKILWGALLAIMMAIIVNMWLLRLERYFVKRNH